jgi:hypothetical protein
MKKVWDSVESLVDSLVVSLSAGHLVMAAKAHHGIASDNSGCGVNYYDRLTPSRREIGRDR